MITAQRGLGYSLDLPQDVTQNAALLESEVNRLDADIQACGQAGKVDQGFLTAWGLWRDTALEVAKQAQSPVWYEGPVGSIIRIALSGDGIRTQMKALIAWRDQAKAAGCTMNGPDPAVPPMPLETKLLWTVGGLVGLGILGLAVYGVATKQGPVTIINRIVGRRRR